MNSHRHHEILVARAFDAARTKAWSEATALLSEAIEQRPTAAGLWVQLGHFLKEENRLGEALLAYETAIERDGSDVDARLHHAHLLKRIGLYRDALTAFNALAAIPCAGHIQPEVAGLQALLANEEAGVCFTERAGSSRKNASSKYSWLSNLRNHASACGNSHSQVNWISSLWRRVRQKSVSLRLEPAANLIIDDGVFRATSNNPRFRLLVNGSVHAEHLAGKWMELSLQISGEPECYPDPVLWIEHEANWQKFSAIPLNDVGDGLWSINAYLQPPILSLRMDPIHSPGVFSITDVRFNVASKPISVNAPVLVDDYTRWIACYDSRAKSELATETGGPVPTEIGWLMPVGQENEAVVRTTLNSLKGQTSPFWRLLALVGSDATESVRALLEEEAKQDPRIVVDPTPAKATGELLAHGVDGLSVRYFGHLEPGDRLAAGAIATFLDRLSVAPRTQLIYCDDDMIDAKGRRHSPRFKPDWNPDYFLCFDYIGRAALMSLEAVQACGGYRSNYPGLEDYDLILRLCANAPDGAIAHIPWPLWHFSSTPAAQPIASVVRAALTERDSPLSVQTGAVPGTNRLVWPMPEPVPHVTVIIPTKDRVDLLSRAVATLLERTDYGSFDIIVVDNGSTELETLAYLNEIASSGRVQVLRDDGPFNFSRLNNHAVTAARGAVLALLNNDVEITDRDWLSEMVRTAVDPDVGAVGAKLLYGSGHVQHAGILGGVGTAAAHGHKYFTTDAPGYMNRLIVQQQVLAVTAACLVVETSKFRAVGGFDEDNLAVAFNDVDLCLKLSGRGWRTIFTPWARLVHHESLSRGHDVGGEREARFVREADFLQRKWGNCLLQDPFYSPHLTHRYEDFALSIVDG